MIVEPARGRSRAERLVGQSLPRVRLACAGGNPVDVRVFAEGFPVVLYFYPGAICSPEDGHQSPAMDLAQHRAFAAHRSEFHVREYRAVAISTQSEEDYYGALMSSGTEQTHLMLSDPELAFARSLGLPTFNMNGKDWYCRTMVVAIDARVVKAFSISHPPHSPAQVIAWMKLQGIVAAEVA